MTSVAFPDPELTKERYNYVEREQQSQTPRQERLSSFWRRRGLVVVVVFLAFSDLVQYFKAPRSSPRRSVLIPQDSSANVNDGGNLEAPAKRVVLASYKKQDMDWTSKIPPEVCHSHHQQRVQVQANANSSTNTSWRIYRYVLDDARSMLNGTPSARAAPSSSTATTEPGTKARARRTNYARSTSPPSRTTDTQTCAATKRPAACPRRLSTCPRAQKQYNGSR